MTAQHHSRQRVLAALEAQRAGADLNSRPQVDRAEQLYIAIQSALQSAAMYREMGRQDEADNYAAKAQHLVADFRAEIRGQQ